MNEDELKALGFEPEPPPASAIIDPQELAELGFEPEPKPNPDMSGPVAYLQKNAPKEAKSIGEALVAGFGQSVIGIAANKNKPGYGLADDPEFSHTIAAGLGQIIGDLPAIAAGTIGGALGGSAAGTAVAPGIGTVVGGVAGAGAGGNALPAAMRKFLMEYYDRGEIGSFSEFLEMTSAAAKDGLEQGAIGAVASPLGFGAGKLVGKVGGKVVGQAAAKVAAKVAAGAVDPVAEVSTIVGLNAALKGEVPKLEDFTDASTLVLSMAGTLAVAKAGGGKVAGKLRKIYAETGVRPEEVVEQAKHDPVLTQELLGTKDEIPEQFKPLVEKGDTVTMADVVNEPPPTKPQRSEAFQALRESIVADRKELQSQPKFYEKLKNLGNEAYTKFVDQLDPIKDVSEEGYVLARSAVDAPAKVRHALEFGTLEYNTLKRNGEGLKQILDTVDDIESFETYLIARRAKDYEARGLDIGLDKELLDQVYNEGNAIYEGAAKRITDFNKRNLKYMLDAGLIDKNSFDAISAAGENYVPVKEIISDKGTQYVRKSKNVLKRVRGVEEGRERLVLSPLRAMVENVEAIYRAAEKNRAVKKIVESNPEAFEPVKSQAKPTVVSKEEAAKGLNLDTAAADKDSFTVFRKGASPLAADEFDVFIDGKRKVFKAKTPMIAEAVREIGGSPPALNLALRFLNAFTKVFRAGIALTPDFTLRNTINDQIQRGVMSQSKGLPFLEVADTIQAMGSIFKKDSVYQDWLKSGGANGAFLQTDYLATKVLDAYKETGFLDKVHNYVKNPKEFAKMIVEKAEAPGLFLEQATRVGEFARARRQGQSLQEAGWRARNVTVDFSRRGQIGSQLNAISAFTNAGIQSIDKLAKTFSDPATRAVATQRAMIYITAPSILLWLSQKDDPRYQGAEQWKKDNYWLFYTDDWQEAVAGDMVENIPPELLKEVDGKLYINKGIEIKLPKGHQLGLLFGTLPVRVLEKFVQENPDALEGYVENLIKSTMITPFPNALIPGFEQWANKSWFTGRQLIPKGLEDVAPQYQYTRYTSETAKQLAKLVPWISGNQEAGMSPILIDNYIAQWTGGMGKLAINLSDAALRKAGITPKNIPQDEWEKIPFVRAFMARVPSAQSSYITKFYEKADLLNQKANTLKKLAKTPGAEQEFEDYAGSLEEQNLKFFRATARELSEHRKLINSVYMDPEMSQDEKRQLIDGYTWGMIAIAKDAVEQFEESEK